MKTLRSVCVIIFTLMGALTADGQDVVTNLNAFLDGLAQQGGLNGNVLVAERNKVLVQRSLGYADFESGRLNTEQTEFQLASVSKLFTAVAVLQLKEQGKLDLEDPLAKHFPRFPYKTMTLRQLLSHSSGLTDSELEAPLREYQTNHPDHPLTNGDLISAIAAGKNAPKLQPGEKWWYCNAGYQLLAALVEQVSQETFDQYLNRHIFVPAHMSHTYLKTAILHTGETSQYAQNYDFPFRYSDQRRKLEGKAGYYTDALFGHSNIISTTGDLLCFDEALYSGILLKPGTLEEAYSPDRLKNGEPVRVWKNIGGMGASCDALGWFAFDDESMGRIVWHAGGMAGCATIILRNVTRRQTVIVLDNVSSEALYLKGLSAMRILNRLPALSIRLSLARIYGRILVKSGPDAAFVRLQQFKADSEHFNLNENDMNRLGYELLENGHTVPALETFKSTVWLYPGSDNAFNSYAEALEKAGQTNEARQMFRKSLELNPDNADSRSSLSRLEDASRQ